MKKYFKTIRFRMFMTYAMIIMLMVVVLSLFIYFFVFSRFQDNVYNTLISMVETQLVSVEKEVDSMDALALNILTSHIIKDYLEDSDDIADDDVEKSKQVSAQLSTLVAPSFTVPRAMLHGFNGRTFTSQYDSYIEVDISDIAWYEDAVDKNGLMYLSMPYDGDDETMSTDIYNTEKMVSLCRVAFDTYQRPKGIVEVVQYSRKLFGSLDRLADNNTYIDIVVYNENGKQIYPYEANAVPNHDYIEIIKSYSDADLYEVQLFEERFDNEDVILGVQKSKALDWTVILVSSKKMVMQSVNDYVMSLIISAIIVVIVALVISLFSAQQITAPILALRKRMQLFNVSKLEPDKIEIEYSSLVEIDDLNNSFYELSTQLKESVRYEMLAHQHELQYKMLALQSQMNPHFLYNSLSMISAMAEEEMTEDISYTCKLLSSMLRYIASGKANIVTVETELEHTKQFLEFSLLRFKEKLKYDINIPDALLNEEIPKLSIQPLVENSVKYCSVAAPPWFISIKGEIDEDGWMIKVIDNGIGFSEEAKSEFYEKIKSIEENSVTPTLELDGMGLVNVYTRLKLKYKNKMIFTIKSLDNKGTEITFGKKN